jgi:hypothetical protein
MASARTPQLTREPLHMGPCAAVFACRATERTVRQPRQGLPAGRPDCGGEPEVRLEPDRVGLLPVRNQDFLAGTYHTTASAAATVRSLSHGISAAQPYERRPHVRQDASEPEGFGPTTLLNASWAAGNMRDMGSLFTLYWTQAFFVSRLPLHSAFSVRVANRT